MTHAEIVAYQKGLASIGHKLCSGCKTVLELELFSKHKTGRRSACRMCHNKKSSDYRYSHREQINAYNRMRN